MDNQFLSSLDELNFREWSEITSDTKICIDFYQQVGLIGYILNETCSIDHQKQKLGASSRMTDGWVWRCTECRSTKSIRHETFFANSKLTICQIFDLMYSWSQGLDSYSFLRRHCKFVSESTIVNWKNFLRNVCSEYFRRNPLMIAGVRHIVEVDESALVKKKYNRRREVSNQWVFGSIDRDTRECFALLVDRRDVATLLPIIRQYIRPDTTIYKDQWAAYNNIANSPHQYIHHTAVAEFREF